MFQKMKKSSLIKAMLVLTLVISATLIGHNRAQAETSSVLNAKTGEATTTISAHILQAGDKADQAKRAEYEIHVASNQEELVVPVEIKSAGILQVFFTDDSYNLEAEFYSDSACTKAIEYNSNYGFGILPKAGTYYVKFVNSYGDYGATDIIDLQAQFSCQVYPNATKLTNGKWTSVGVQDYTKPVYLQLSVSKTALVEVDFQAENTNSFVTLCNSSKKAITEDMTVSSTEGKKAFVVKKGTYYLKVTTNAWWVRVKTAMKAVTDNSGSSKAKAATLKIGTAKNGVFFIDEKTSKTDWFKFTLSKPTKLKLILSGNVSAGYLRYELTSTKIEGSLTGYLSDVGNVDESKLAYYKDFELHESLPAGTYYIRVYKDSAKSCGNYSIKVAKR